MGDLSLSVLIKRVLIKKKVYPPDKTDRPNQTAKTIDTFCEMFPAPKASAKMSSIIRIWWWLLAQDGEERDRGRCQKIWRQKTKWKKDVSEISAKKVIGKNRLLTRHFLEGKRWSRGGPLVVIGEFWISMIYGDYDDNERGWKVYGWLLNNTVVYGDQRLTR